MPSDLTKTGQEFAFAGILSPFDEAEFLGSILGKQSLHIKGAPSKFSTLIAWREVDFYLSRGGGNLSRVSVTNGPNCLPESSYTLPGVSGSPYIRAGELIDLARGGATVVIEAGDEVFEGVAGANDAIAYKLEVPVSACVHASWRRARTHVVLRDRDALVLQVAGQMECHTHRPALAPPSAPDCESTTVSTAWIKQVMEQGDCIYVPRGWWYSSQPMDRSSLSLVFSFSNPTGLNLVERLVDQLRLTRIMQVNCPRFSEASVRSRFMTSVQEELLRTCTAPGLSLGFTNDMRAMADPRKILGVPWSMDHAAEAFPPDWYLISRVQYSDSIFGSVAANGCEAFFEGTKLRLDADEESMLLELNRRGAVTIRELTAQGAPGQSAIPRLVERGLAAIYPPGALRDIGMWTFNH